MTADQKAKAISNLAAGRAKSLETHRRKKAEREVGILPSKPAQQPPSPKPPSPTPPPSPKPAPEPVTPVRKPAVEPVLSSLFPLPCFLSLSLYSACCLFLLATCSTNRLEYWVSKTHFDLNFTFYTRNERKDHDDMMWIFQLDHYKRGYLRLQ
jgi:hypothetical protein